MVSNNCLRLLTVTTLFSLSLAVPFQDGYHNIPETVMFKQSGNQYDTKEDDSQYWLTEGTNTLKHKIEEKVKRGVAKNVILFLGDGMSIPTLAATRILLGQQSKKPGEETVLSFEKFPYAGLSKTYCVDSQVADSACSATAYLNGVKGNIGTIGVTASVKKRDCDAMNNPNHQTSSIAAWAQTAGKSTGIVTTSRVSHASPAGVYAHIAHRDWEYDGAVADDKQDPEKCMDITKQLVTQTPGKNLKVILGGGRGTFLTVNDTDPEYSKEKGWRTDGKNLVEAWLADKKGDNVKAKYVWNRGDLLDAKDSDFLLGLFEPSHMKYHLQADPKTEPTLEEMTEVAINILSKESKGYFLFVEGAKIDMAHHENQAKMSLDETIEFAKAIQKAHNLTSEDDTLIVVTADHAHTMSISGYPARGTDILTGLQNGRIDGIPYSTLSYANGPGYKQKINGSSSRYDVSRDDRGATTYRFPGLAPLNSETHGGDDVAVFSRGPWAHILSGSFEQNYIPLVMGYAARVGPTGNISMPGSSSPIIQYSFLVLLLCVLISLFTR